MLLSSKLNLSKNRKNIKNRKAKCFIISLGITNLKRYWENEIQILKMGFCRPTVART